MLLEWNSELTLPLIMASVLGLGVGIGVGVLLTLLLTLRTKGKLEGEIAHLQQGLHQHQSDIATHLKTISDLTETSHQQQISASAQRQQIHYLEQTLEEIKQDHQHAELTLSALHNEKAALSIELTQVKTSLEQKEQHHRDLIAQLHESKASMQKEFELLANKVLDEKGKTFSASNQQHIDSLLRPFREQIDGFQRRINEVHESSIKDRNNLQSEIKKVLEIGLQMSKDATNLTSALKGDSQQRGAWGEAQLKRTLEMSGLIEDDHYTVQTAFKDRDGKQKQTDYLIKLPDGKHIIIDSKVTLNAYDRAIGAESTEAYQLAMSEHVRAVRRHIDDLASKDYTNLVGVHSPSFVLMFMPIEPAYIEALKHNKDLFEYGYQKNIVLVSHTTLIPILRTVSNLWMIEQSNAEAREISERAGEIFNQVCVVAERLQKLGMTLSSASNHYNNTVKALSGKQGLYGKVERFDKLSAKVSKVLPQVETSHIDFESDRLTLMAQEINPTSEIGPEQELAHKGHV